MVETVAAGVGAAALGPEAPHASAETAVAARQKLAKALVLDRVLSLVLAPVHVHDTRNRLRALLLALPRPKYHGRTSAERH
jgi:hypothetical protein